MSEEKKERIERGVRVIRLGHGANCSSIGSVIDTLFASAVIGGAVFTAITAALAREKVSEVKPSSPERAPKDKKADDA